MEMARKTKQKQNKNKNQKEVDPICKEALRALKKVSELLVELSPLRSRQGRRQ
jgi:hypothetical protein